MAAAAVSACMQGWLLAGMAACALLGYAWSKVTHVTCGGSMHHASCYLGATYPLSWMVQQPCAACCHARPHRHGLLIEHQLFDTGVGGDCMLRCHLPCAPMSFSCTWKAREDSSSLTLPHMLSCSEVLASPSALS